MKHIKLLFIIAAISVTTSIKAQKYVGGDISLLPSYEQAGVKFKDIKGHNVKLLPFLKKQGWNTTRVRLFVHPENANQQSKDEGVYQDIDYVIKTAREIKKAGMKFMLDFHYSDTWADPSHQFTPKAWENASATVMSDSVYKYTKESLMKLNNAGVTPDFIQVGNEISYGMLWPTGKVDIYDNKNWDILTDFIKSGCKACREICPKAKIIIHIERSGETVATHKYFNYMKQYNVDYDIIGLSYYPIWHGKSPILSNTLNMLEKDFPEKKVMIVETAYYYHYQPEVEKEMDYSSVYPITPEGQKAYTATLINELKRHNNVNGLFWWFPEENCYNNKVIKFKINRGLFDNDSGKALPALYEMKRFCQ